MSPKMLIFIPIYCTPFFPRCKEEIYKFTTNFEKFSDRQENYGENPVGELPKKRKNRAQGFPGGGLPQGKAQKQSPGVPHADVSLTQGEAEIQPYIEGDCTKEGVRQEGQLFPQRTQKSVEQSQQAA